MNNIEILEHAVRSVRYAGYIERSHPVHHLISQALSTLFNVQLPDDIIIQDIQIGSISFIDEFIQVEHDPNEILVRTFNMRTQESGLTYSLRRQVFEARTLEEGLRLSMAEQNIQNLMNRIQREAQVFEARMKELNERLELEKNIVLDIKSEVPR